MLRNARWRAVRRGLPFTITKEDIVIPVLCPVLGIPLRRRVGKKGPTPNSPSLDCLDPRLGYVPGNVVVISHVANTAKGNLGSYELMRIVRWLRRHNL